jgi:WD40 repeat protein
VLALVGSVLIIALVILSIQASSALNQVTLAGQTLTPIPVTLTTVARTISEGNTTMELLRLAAAANRLLLARNGNVETAALLGIRTLNTAYLPEADSALMRSMETMFTRTVFTGHSGAVYGVAFSPDGKIIASGSGDSTVRLWDVTTKQVLYTLTGHTDSIYSVAVSPDGKYVLSGSKDHTARLWDVKTGRTVRIFVDTTYLRRAFMMSASGPVWEEKASANP